VLEKSGAGIARAAVTVAVDVEDDDY